MLEVLEAIGTVALLWLALEAPWLRRGRCTICGKPCAPAHKAHPECMDDALAW